MSVRTEVKLRSSRFQKHVPIIAKKQRLDKMERQALKKALQRVKGEVYLFGSRIDPKKRGGDIDLLIYSRENSYNLSRRVRTAFFEFCEEKIDVVVMHPNKMTSEQRAFVSTLNMVRMR